MTENLDTILARVASGEISAEDAEPLVAAAVAATDAEAVADSVDAAGDVAGDANEPATPRDQAASPEVEPFQPASPDPGARPQRNVRLQVTERGRSMVDLRIPIGIAGMAGALVPGLSGPQADRIREALRSGRVGPVLEVLDEDGDGVIISTE